MKEKKIKWIIKFATSLCVQFSSRKTLIRKFYYPLNFFFFHLEI
jgi:hypothetical protein